MGGRIGRATTLRSHGPSHQEIPFDVIDETHRSGPTRLLAYIASEPEANLFIEGDIEHHGLESDTVEVFALGRNWDCIVLRYFNDYVVYSRQGSYDGDAVHAFLREHKPFMISGTTRSLKPIIPRFPDRTAKEEYLCRCNRERFSFTQRDLPIRLLGPDDAKALTRLYRGIDEFGTSYRDHEQEKTEELRRTLKTTDTAMGLFEGPHLICSACCTAKTTHGAMLIGVATHPDYRNRGYATQVVGSLCRHSFTEGLSFISLFYDNPKAGSIYRRLGFGEIGKWTMLASS